MIDRRSFPPELDLTDTEAAIAGLLVSRERLSSTVAFSYLYGDRPPDKQPKFTIVKTHVCHLRRKLAKMMNLRVETIWGWGWTMPPADRDKLKNLVRKND